MTGSEERNARLAYVRELRAQEAQLNTRLEKLKRLIALIEDSDPIEILSSDQAKGSDAGASVGVRQSFKGLSYRDAIRVALRQRPQNNPELADTLHAGGMNVKRSVVKVNVDSVMKRLKTSGEAVKSLDGRWVLRETPSQQTRLLA
jgi:hypothetical protein